ncbi:TetR/AcrR family transcriptional regulator [Saccharothrix coeruleofusca]|uniref:TetR/AcrR family transcriptional regulator n=1 Tax=Saccharothrix coeruleofusca TaxID=33919 RepID=UPI00166FC379|nr:TetR/AcrR family transcriptional regulator [Saccharothrix coeruleofusca]
MTTRSETAAATRQALLRAAEDLLDRGGVEAVTLRAVGSGAGVSHSAAYRHFPDKDAMLAAISIAAWEDLTQRIHDIAAHSVLSPAAALREAIGVLVTIARSRPNLYRLMLTRAPFGPAASEVGARSQDVFHTLVARVVPVDQARPFSGLLLAAAHGVADLELGGYLDAGKYEADGDQLIDLLIRILPTR